MATTQTTGGASKVPFHGGICCYACDARPTGLRDRRPEGGELELACERHADPRVRIFAACSYCSEPVRKGALVIDGMFAHRRCYNEDCDGTAQPRAFNRGR